MNIWPHPIWLAWHLGTSQNRGPEDLEGSTIPCTVAAGQGGVLASPRSPIPRDQDGGGVAAHTSTPECVWGLPQTEMACQGMYVVEVRGRLAKVSSLLQCESWALNSGHQAWHQAPFSTAPSHSAFSGNRRQSFSASL